MTALAKVAVVELMMRQDCYCVTENPLALSIYIYTMHSVMLKTSNIMCVCARACSYAAPI
jgi:hypothetical protein